MQPWLQVASAPVIHARELAAPPGGSIVAELPVDTDRPPFGIGSRPLSSDDASMPHENGQYNAVTKGGEGTDIIINDPHGQW